MERLNRAAIISQLIGRLREAGSWSGETHVQKAVYLMQDLLEVPTDYHFILYKHGPYSFDLSDELTSLRGDELLELQSQAPPYGPRYAVTALGRKLRMAYPKTLSRYECAINGVAAAIGSQTIGELERLATALFVTKRLADQHSGSLKSRAALLNKLKPHVSIETATNVVEKVDSLIEQHAEAEL